MEVKNNYYEILEVQTNASQHDIAMAYEKAKRTYSLENPALYNTFSPQEATALRSLIDEAYSVLSNQSYRNIYEKRRLAKSYSDEELSLAALKEASQKLFSETTAPPPIAAPKAELQEPSVAPKLAENSFVPNLDVEQEIINTSEWTGAQLQKIREYKKLSIDALHEKTKVNPWYLKALETMDSSNLPAPVFVRGYVVQMAKTLGLNDKTVADSYMKLYKQKLEKHD